MANPGTRVTIAELMGAVAALAVACRWPVVLVPLITCGLSARLGARHRRAGWALGLVAACLYGPFAWLLVVRDSWDYRLLWLNLWPILPGLVPALWLHPRAPLEFVVMGALTVLWLAGLTWLGAGGRWRLLAAVLLALLVAVPQACIAYALFRF